MSETASLAVVIFVVAWIFSMFLGAGPKGLVRTVGTAISMVLLFLRYIVAGIVIGIVMALVMVAIGGLLRWLIFGSRTRRRYYRTNYRTPERDPFEPLDLHGYDSRRTDDHF